MKKPDETHKNTVRRRDQRNTQKASKGTGPQVNPIKPKGVKAVEPKSTKAPKPPRSAEARINAMREKYGSKKK